MTQKSLDALPEEANVPDLSDLPYEIDYVLVFYKDQKGNKVQPLTFRDQKTSFQTLMERFLATTNFKIPEAKDYYFTLNNGSRIDTKWEVKDMLKVLGKDKMDGIVLLVQGSNFTSTEEDYQNQCCVVEYYKTSSSNFNLKFEFTLTGNNAESIYHKCSPSTFGEDILLEVIGQIKKQFGINDLSLQLLEQAYFEDEKGTKVALDKHHALNRQKIYNGNTVKLKFKNPKKLVVKRVQQKKFNSWIVIYKQGETEPIRIKYDQIYHLTFGELYKSKLQLKGSQKKKDAIYCLKVMDTIVKPLDLMSKVQMYFINNEIKPIEVVGKVVNEKMIFFNVVPSLTKDSEFTLSELQIPTDQKDKREECRKLIDRRAKDSQIEYFKKAEHVEPILIYTSELKYKDQKSKQKQVIYVSLNKYLRETPVLSLDELALNKEWRLRYASTLLKHLSKAQLHEGIVWRGISYNPNIIKQDIGKIFTFKQFTSTSTDQRKTDPFIKADETGFCHLYCFNVKTGRSVIKYSAYEQGEILLEPHTQFQLTKIQNSEILNTKLNKKMNYKIYHFIEQQTSKDLPGTKANFVVWIDDKTGQNKQIYEQIKVPSETTIFQQITSTADLQKWLDKYKGLFHDGTANLIFITNMTRKQGAKLNETAGIDGVKLIRKVSPKIPIFFFIGNLQATNTKLANSQINMDQITVGNQISSIQKYLNQQLTKKK